MLISLDLTQTFIYLKGFKYNSANEVFFPFHGSLSRSILRA